MRSRWDLTDDFWNIEFSLFQHSPHSYRKSKRSGISANLHLLVNKTVFNFLHLSSQKDRPDQGTQIQMKQLTSLNNLCSDPLILCIVRYFLCNCWLQLKDLRKEKLNPKRNLFSRLTAGSYIENLKRYCWTQHRNRKLFHMDRISRQRHCEEKLYCWSD